jgi:hypothetical protein
MPGNPLADADPELSGLEVVRDSGRVLAYIVRAHATSERTRFLTPDDSNLQLGLIAYRAGQRVAPHYHLPVERTTRGTLEFLSVREGSCELDLYDDGNRRVATLPLNVGDVVLLVTGGHGIRMLTDTVLLEVKQGPYTGVEEKVRFDDPGQ